MEKVNEMPQILNSNEPHMALVFLLDVSGSMTGEPLNELVKGINKFKDSVCQDEQTKRILDVAIIAFDDKWSIIQEFVPIEYMHRVELVAKGGTFYNEPINKALEMVTDRSRLYRTTGTEPYKPWIMLITDGEPLDNIEETINKVNDMVEKNKVKFWSLAVPGANTQILHRLSGRNVLNIAENDFVGFFDWVNKSMRAVSTSSPGEKVVAPELPSTTTIDIQDLF